MEKFKETQKFCFEQCKVQGTAHVEVMRAVTEVTKILTEEKDQLIQLVQANKPTTALGSVHTMVISCAHTASHFVTLKLFSTLVCVCVFRSACFHDLFKTLNMEWVLGDEVVDDKTCHWSCLGSNNCVLVPEQKQIWWSTAGMFGQCKGLSRHKEQGTAGNEC